MSQLNAGPRRPITPRKMPRRIHPVWWLNAAVLAATIAAATLVAGYEPVAGGGLPWWVLAVAIAVAERWPIELQFRRSSHSFSLTDIPLTLALLFATGPEALAAVACGSAVALGMRRLPPIKFVFNLGQFLLATSVGLMVVHGVAGDGFGALAWIGALIATQLGGLITIVLMCAAMYLAEGSLTREQVRQMFGMDAVITVTNTCLALLSAVVLIERPDATPLLAVPAIVAFLGYRNYVAERQRHEKLEFLYEANRTLAQSPEVAAALEGLLARALEAFRAEQAEIILFSPDGAPPLRTSLGPGDVRQVMEPIDAGVEEAVRDVVGDSDQPIALARPFRTRLGDYLAERGVRHGMLALLHGKERVIGAVVLANRFGLSRGFTPEDLALFETLAANASAALQFDRLEQAVFELRDLQEKLHHQAYHDPLTGLANRALFGQEVRGALAGGVREVAVLFVDLDDFKTVNDTLGHLVGDEVLRAAAGRLENCVRGDDLVARLGGDEFALLLTEPEGIDAAAVAVAQRVLDAFEDPISAGDQVLGMRLSIGVATSPHSGVRAEDLLRDADVAMYEAKQAGKRRYAIFDPTMREAIVRRHGLKEELERAVLLRQLAVQYQPIIDLTTGHTVAAEALVRWNHPGRGRIPPGEFIPLAEETGLIVPIGRFVLEQACQQVRTWEHAGPEAESLTVQVNLSAIELEDEGLVDGVVSAIESSGIRPEQLTLEVTESLLMQDRIRGAATLDALRALGVRLSLDDFGTGYSSLSYLRALPLDQLKIAREFVDTLAENTVDTAFVKLMVELANTMGLVVVAEGIETAEQLQALRELGCDLGQGYYFAAPLDEDADWFARPRRGELPPLAA
jgi:diguanylate cyclase (GGDEF)-like protein